MNSLSPMNNQSGIAKKIVIAVLVLVVGALVAIGMPMFAVDESEVEKEKIVEALQQFSMARALGNVVQVIQFVSNDFKDAGMDYRAAIKTLSKKRPGYTTFYMNASLAGILARVSYKRMEKVDGKSVTTVVLEELWKKGDDGNWRLFKFSKVDRAAFLGTSPVESDEMEIVTKESIEKKADEEKVTVDVAVKAKANVDAEPAKEKVLEETKAVKAEEPKLEKVIKETKLSDDSKKEDEKAVKKQKIQPPYDSSKKRDPFKSLIAGFGSKLAGSTTVRNRKKCDPKRQREFLESFETFSVQLVGIVQGKTGYALVETPNGNGYTVKRGMHMGKHCGKVIGIKSNMIIVSEQVQKHGRGFRIVKREIKLKRKEN